MAKSDKKPAVNSRKFQWKDGDVKWIVPPTQDHSRAVNVKTNRPNKNN